MFQKQIVEAISPVLPKDCGVVVVLVCVPEGAPGEFRADFAVNGTRLDWAEKALRQWLTELEAMS